MKVLAKDYLKGRLMQLGYSYKRLSSLLGMSTGSLCEKLNNPEKLRCRELKELAEYLKIPEENLGAIVKGEEIEI
jgi:hypothetical protein